MIRRPMMHIDKLIRSGMVHMHLTVPHQQQGPALSSWAQRRV